MPVDKMNAGSAAETDMAASQAILPFELLEDLNLRCGYERSFKMSAGKLLANRYLLAIDPRDLTRQQMASICRRINMPEAYLDRFEKNLGDANLVFLGFEDNEPGCTYKIYLEFWDKLIGDIREIRRSKAPMLLHLGFKWATEDNSRRAVSRYMCYPMLSVARIQSRLSELFLGGHHTTSKALAEEIINFAAARHVDRPFTYLEVDEDNEVRRSFDINLYSANFRIGEIHSSLSKLQSLFMLDRDRFRRLYRLVGDKRFGHLSAGLDRQGEEFVTIYYEP